jgi:hypothetical protein
MSNIAKRPFVWSPESSTVYVSPTTARWVSAGSSGRAIATSRAGFAVSTVISLCLSG